MKNSNFISKFRHYRLVRALLLSSDVNKDINIDIGCECQRCKMNRYIDDKI